MKKFKKINNKTLLNSHEYLSNKSLAEITFAQKKLQKISLNKKNSIS